MMLQVDDVERVEAEIAQIVVDGAASSSSRDIGRDPRAVGAAPRADLGDDRPDRRDRDAAPRGSAGW